MEFILILSFLERINEAKQKLDWYESNYISDSLVKCSLKEDIISGGEKVYIQQRVIEGKEEDEGYISVCKQMGIYDKWTKKLSNFDLELLGRYWKYKDMGKVVESCPFLAEAEIIEEFYEMEKALNLIFTESDFSLQD